MIATGPVVRLRSLAAARRPNGGTIRIGARSSVQVSRLRHGPWCVKPVT